MGAFGVVEGKLGGGASFLGAPWTFCDASLVSYSYHTPLMRLLSFLGAGVNLLVTELLCDSGDVGTIVEASEEGTRGGVALNCSTEEPRLSILRIIALQVCDSCS